MEFKIRELLAAVVQLDSMDDVDLLLIDKCTSSIFCVKNLANLLGSTMFVTVVNNIKSCCIGTVPIFWLKYFTFSLAMIKYCLYNVAYNNSFMFKFLSLSFPSLPLQ